jgi:ectoine hydroxylase-related dioxygenase (phytanoyl-CoA dioxygenase family)
VSQVEAPAAQSVRAVTEEEVAFYRRNGWVHLKGLFTPELTAEVLVRVKDKMGERASADLGDNRAAIMSPELAALWRNWQYPANEDEWFRALAQSPQMAAVANRLWGEARGVRFWSDTVMCKMPASEGGSKTPWHQDFPYHAMDRQGNANIWVALVDVPPEMGSMRFLNGSHRAGPMGRVIQRTDGIDLLDMYPELAEEYEISEPLHLAAGDATVHNLCTIHYAAQNDTQDPRWAYVTGMFPADVLYTGAQQRRTDDLDLKVNEPYDHPRFPLLVAPTIA